VLCIVYCDYLPVTATGRAGAGVGASAFRPRPLQHSLLNILYTLYLYYILLYTYLLYNKYRPPRARGCAYRPCGCGGRRLGVPPAAPAA